MTPDKIRELKEAFMACDDNGDGKISMAEFKKGMEGHIDSSEIEDVFRSIDTDGGGFIEYSEFLAAAISKDTYMREDKLKAAWDRLDADDSGYLDHDDFRKLCKNMFSEEDLLVMIQEVDPDGDGKISWNEFLQIMKKDELQTMTHEQLSEQLKSTS
jgi:Ca2+-binding EF-hand superfamily protein